MNAPEKLDLVAEVQIHVNATLPDQPGIVQLRIY